MRIARVNAGMASGGETVNPIRSPTGRQCTNPELSFANWSPEDPLPSYDDHVRGWKLKRSRDSELTGDSGIYESTDGTHPSGEPYFPSNPAFGASSVVSVNPIQALGGTASDTNSIVDDAFARQTSLTVGPRGTDFSIWLVYQGTNREPHLHRVYSSMLVTNLNNRIALRILHCDEPSDFHLLVQGNHLWHSGSITDKINPLTLEPTCFLAPRTVVTVKMIATYPDFVRFAGRTDGGTFGRVTRSR
jgi:hypothetical protein